MARRAGGRPGAAVGDAETVFREQWGDPAPLSPNPVHLNGERLYREGRGYHKALGQARSLVYVEDQYLWSLDVAQVFADALARAPQLRRIVVILRFPDQDGRTSLPPNLAGREPGLRLLRAAGRPRFAVYGLENDAGTPIYVYAKVCLIDDTWGASGRTTRTAGPGRMTAS